MVSPQMRSTEPDRAAAAPYLLASIAAGSAARAQARARDPRPRDVTHRSHRGAPALIRFALAGLLGKEVRPSVLGVVGGKTSQCSASRSAATIGNARSRLMRVTPAIATHTAKAAFARPDQPSPSSAPQALLLGHGTGVRGVPGYAPRGPDTGKDRLERSFIVEYPDAGVLE
jgi:hypothetical protein